MKAVNPYLPNYEYVPDGEPHVFGDRLYIYGSHDKFNGLSFCLNDYVCWSASINDLSNWRYEGVIFQRKQDKRGKPGIFNAIYAPDVCKGPDGRYYLYYFICYKGFIGVAVSDTPNGKFQYLGDVKYEDGVSLGGRKEPLQFDPGVFRDDDGKIYLYTGFGPENTPSIFMGGHKATENGPMGFELCDDMITIKKGPVNIGVKGKKEGKGSGYEGHEFFEASSMRKRGDKYYFIYSSMLSHELCYAVGDSPLGKFEYGGILVSNGDLGLKKEAVNYTGNNHGSIENINGQEYVFYHRHTNRHWCSRQACAEKLRFNNGRFLQAEMTSCGLSDEALGKGKYGAYIACNLYSKKGTYMYGPFKTPKGIHPYFTQKGRDREDNPNQYIANMTDGATAVYKYFTISNGKQVKITADSKGNGKLEMLVNDKLVCSIDINKKSKEFSRNLSLNCADAEIKFVYRGKGHIDFVSFEII